jgi:hypothetical protein
LPIELSAEMESGPEVFLYRHGMLATQAIRQGKPVLLKDITETQVPSAWFVMPPLASVTTDVASSYYDQYYRAMFP